MSDLNRAIEIAVQAHAGQVDKAGAPYILHPLRVMMRMETPETMMAAVLHDVVEDTDWTLEALKQEGFSPKVLDAVEHLTWRPEEEYEDFLERVTQNSMACAIKVADLEDNMDLTRIEKPGQKDFDRVKKYHKARKNLLLFTKSFGPV